MTEQKPTWIATLPAAKAVALAEHIPITGPCGRRELLEMCGLVEPGQRAIVPDDVHNYDIPNAGPEAPTRSTAADHPAVRDLHPERCTTPAGLRRLDGAA